MEFEEILLEEIITIVKEAKDENFMRIDLKRLLGVRLQEFSETIEESCYGYSDEEYDKACKDAYEDGYAEGWDDAREEIQELAKDMRRYN
jgi:flagellar biosynthesis/type III secretory pathway protein FliH